MHVNIVIDIPEGHKRGYSCDFVKHGLTAKKPAISARNHTLLCKHCLY